MRLVPAAILTAAVLAACSNGPTPEGEPSAPAVSDHTEFPTERPTPTRPASETSTSEPQPSAPRTPPAVKLFPAFPGLPRFERPIAMVEVPGEGVMLLATQPGQVFVFEERADTSMAELALDWRARTRREGNEEGLLGLALDPRFAENRFVYLYYTAAGGARRSVIARFTAMGSGTELRLDPASEQVILEVPQPYSNHNGGALAFGPDGMLYIALGDGGGQGDPHGNGQNPGTLLGSILRLDVRELPYRIPSNNPFAQRPDARGEIWAYGFRNPWRFSFDRETGALWAGDVGQNSWEEVDLVRPGGNYGWNIMEGAACYRPPQGCNAEGLEPPVAVYPLRDGNCAVVGGYVYRGRAIPELRGFYLFADYCSGRVWALDADATAAGERAEAVLLLESGLPIASFAEDAEGELYVLAFDGRAYRVGAE
jgi:glucose/arabinose dehydrogenase